ncbi:DUF1905 domain-containing protein [Deinococcus ficus]|uniref:DUF1905 domain-containing protein n=1 Tax=Deinococcus ficus TaxID=317577 RepID=UPI0003B61EDC|nr:DUF1905 domain-containing protein [Deinococcus ficus]
MTRAAPSRLQFTGDLWQWRGPAPHYFVRVPDDLCPFLKDAAALVTYGWGMIPVTVGIGAAEYDTSLFPKEGGYLVPVRADVRQAQALTEDQPVQVTLTLRSGRASRTVRRRE